MRRKSMSPVELLRLIQFFQIIARLIEEKSYVKDLEYFPIELSRMTGLFYLGSMTRKRVRSILREIAACNLCSLERTKIEMSSSHLDEWQVLSSKIEYDLKNEGQRWTLLDSFLSKNHDLYRKFSEIINRSLHNNIINLKETLTQGFPKPTLSTLMEWGYRLNKVQQNYLDEDVVYPTYKVFRMNKRNTEMFRKTLANFYIEEKAKIQSEETVSLPLLAEKTCAWLKIKREDFRKFLEDFNREFRSDIWLGTGIIRTYAYEGFVVDKQSIMDVLGLGPWFLREVYYKKIDLPQYVVERIPRRFIRIEKKLLKEISD